VGNDQPPRGEGWGERVRVRGKQAFERGVASCIQREVDLDARRRYEM